MFKLLINHIKRWNKWRKYCGNSWFYKIQVLFGRPSPTFYLTFTDEEIAEFEQILTQAFKTQVQILREEND